MAAGADAGAGTECDEGTTSWSTSYTTYTAPAVTDTASPASQSSSRAKKTTKTAAPTTTSTSSAAASASSATSDDLCDQSNVQPAAVSAHNELRAHYQAADLVWNSTLEALAQTWAANCVWEDGGGESVGAGSNIAAISGSDGNTTAQIEMWSSEASEYDSSDPQYSHFTQMVSNPFLSAPCVNRRYTCANTTRVPTLHTSQLMRWVMWSRSERARTFWVAARLIRARSERHPAQTKADITGLYTGMEGDVQCWLRYGRVSRHLRIFVRW